MPGKPLAVLGGLPLVEHVRRRCLGCRTARRVVVATDDERIAATVSGFGGDVVVTGVHPTGTHRVLEAWEGDPSEVVVNVQGDMPLVHPDHVDRAVRAIWAGGAEVVTLVAPPDPGQDLADPAVVKVAGLEGGPVVFGRRSPPPGVRAGIHLGIYAFTAGGLRRACESSPDRDLEQRAWLAAGLTVRLVSVEEAPPSIDTRDQLARLERRFALGELVAPDVRDPRRPRG